MDKGKERSRWTGRRVGRRMRRRGGKAKTLPPEKQGGLKKKGNRLRDIIGSAKEAQEMAKKNEPLGRQVRGGKRLEYQHRNPTGHSVSEVGGRKRWHQGR